MQPEPTFAVANGSDWRPSAGLTRALAALLVQIAERRLATAPIAYARGETGAPDVRLATADAACERGDK